MLKVYSDDGIKEPLIKYRDLSISTDLETGCKEMKFSVPVSQCPDKIRTENYIRTKEHEYVIKVVETDNDNKNITAQTNIDELEGTFFELFESSENTLGVCVNLALVDTGWTAVVEDSIKKKRTVKLTSKYSWDIIKQIMSTYRVEISIDSLNKILYFYETVGSDKGSYFSDQLNLKSINIQETSSDFYTRIYPVGKDGLTIESVNGGSKYINNHKYSRKLKTFYWKDERYSDAKSLLEDATAKLNDMSIPYVAYSCEIIDLVKNSDVKYTDYNVGDVITLINRSTNTKIKQRVKQKTEYPNNPQNNTVEIANRKLTFDEMNEKYSYTSDTVDNITTDNGTVDGDAIDTIDASKVLNIDTVIADSGTFKQLKAENAVISGKLTAAEADIGTLKTTSLTATQADILYAKINDLNVANANISSLSADLGNIHTLIFGTATGTAISTEFSNSVIAVLGDATITSAMISDLNVAKLTGSNISTTKFRLLSDSGNFIISDNTLLIGDGTYTRVQIGKDESNDYSINLWNSSGNLIFSERGITENAVTSPIIRDDMVSDAANIQARKLDISSLYTEMNNSVETLKSTRIYVDDENQTLDAVFKTLVTYTGGHSETWGSAIQQSQTFISNKLWWTDINNEGDSVSSKFSAIDQSLDSVTIRVVTLENQASGDITVYNVVHEPTLDNYPACDWTVPVYPDVTNYPSETDTWTYSDEEYKKHLGSIAYLEGSERSWKWGKTDTGKYGWNEITNTETAYILSRLSELQVGQDEITSSVAAVKLDLATNYSTTTTTRSMISQTSTSILSSVSATYVTQTSHSTDVKSLSASIELKVNTKDLVSEINASADIIRLNSNRISINSTYTTLTETGALTCRDLSCTNAKITGGYIDITTNDKSASVINLNYKDSYMSGSTTISSYSTIYRLDSSSCQINGSGVWITDDSGSFSSILQRGLSTNYISVRDLGYSNNINNVTNFNGAVYAYGGGNIQTSDRNLKHCIKSLDINDSASFVYSLDAVEYKYNNNTSGRLHHGLIAQDVKKSMGENDWGLYVDRGLSGATESNGNDCSKGLRYEELIADLIATVQSQNNRIKNLEEKLRFHVSGTIYDSCDKSLMYIQDGIVQAIL